MLPLWTFAIIRAISSYALDNDKNYEYTCGLGTSLPINSMAPEEDRGCGVDSCSYDLCLLYDVNYLLYSDINSWEHACGWSTSIPINSVVPEEDRGLRIVACNHELCLMFDEDYDKHCPTHGSNQHKHVWIVSPPAVAESKKPLMVILEVTVNTIRDFRFDEDCYSTEITVKMS